MYNKKICVVTTKSITLKGFLIKQLEFLHQNGYEVTVVCDKDDDFYNQLPKSLQYKPVKMKRGIDGLGMLKSIWLLYRLFKSEQYDIVQYSTPNAAFYSSIASWLAKVPVRLYCQWGILYVGYYGIKRKLFKGMEKIICNLSTDIEPDSQGNLDFSRAEGLYPAFKSRVVWNGSANGVDLDKFNINKKAEWRSKIRGKYNIKEDQCVFGFIGRINRDKGINELLTAFKKLHTIYSPQVKLLIAGPEEADKGIEQDIFKWSKECESVIYCGFIDDVEKYYAAMDIFVLPSYREGFGSVVIEAEAMEVPVIVTDIPGPTNAMLNGVTGIVVPKGDIESLFLSMETLLNDAQLCNVMGKNAINFSRTKYDQKKLWRHVLSDRNKLLMKSKLIPTGVDKGNVQG